MIYKQYGKTDMMMSAVGFGGMRFDMTKSLEENADLIVYARSKGINYFDTAPLYCQDKSEEIFGLAAQRMRGERDKIYYATKGFPTTFDTADKAYEGVCRSMERMKIDRLDFYHVWCIRRIEQYHLAMKPGGQYEGLQRCREEGLLGHIVVSTHLQAAPAKEMLAEGKFEGVLLGVNILNFPFRWDAVATAYEMGMGVVAMNPLAGGLIPQNEKELQFLAQPGETPTEAALAFCMGCPQITVTLNGFTNVAQVDMACRVADRTKPLRAEDFARLKSYLSDQMNALCTGCGYCLPECPRAIPIAQYMMYYNLKLLFERSDPQMIEALKNEINVGTMGAWQTKAMDCIECGRCERACTQHLPIIKRLRAIQKYHLEIDRQVNKA